VRARSTDIPPFLVPHLSVSILDNLILGICGRNVVPIKHLIGSWRRAMDLQRKTPASRLDAGKIRVLKEAKRMCVNYALYCITMPDMFGWVAYPCGGTQWEDPADL